MLIIAIGWVCVVIFACTGIIALLHIAGIEVVRVPSQYASKIVKLVIIEVATACVGAFGVFIYSLVHVVSQDPGGIIVREGGPAVAVNIGTDTVWISSKHVVNCYNPHKDINPEGPCEAQFATLKVSLDTSVTDDGSFDLPLDESHTLKLGQKSYQIELRGLGHLKGNIKYPNLHGVDFALVGIKPA